MAANLLLVDDNGNRRDAVRTLLKSSGSLTVEAADCMSAISMLETEKFDLILLDITLPDRSGFRVLEFLEKNHIAGKVMVITGTMGVANVSRSGTPGAREYLTKPYDPRDLSKSIEHVLSGRSEKNLKIQIIKAGDFVISTPTGDLDMKTSREGLAEIAETGTDLQDYTVLIDLRDIKSRLSMIDIYELAYELVKYGKTFRRKTAVLARDDKDIGQARFFEDAAQNRGFKVRAFTVFEEAIIWLSSTTKPTGNE
jgi:DNA-binding response OmpR family regulator